METYGKSLAQMAGGNMVAYVVALIIGIILSVGVAIPVTNDVLTTANLTGVAKTVTDVIPVFVAFIPLALVASVLR